MLLTADQLFEDFHSADNLTLNANDIKLLIKRTYELTDHKHKVAKRSADDFLFQDNKGK